HPMKKEDDGAWKKIIMVPPGRYEYRFLVDGEWWNDPGNSQVCPNCFGSLNNFLIVE
ncbi:MAG: glycogen-binding domain-containing protein, partial [Proteobacteria bacterium]|nr:glycogen-binding domain-containing protein [Pseudomonadota bacterium]